LTLIDFVKAREGREKDNGDGTVSSYWDANGKVWTIGYGTTGLAIIQGLLWTYAECDAALQSRLDGARQQLIALSPGVDWPPGAEDSLTDFVYNEGSGNYQGSTVRKCVLAGDWDGVKAHLLDWEFAGGKRLGGLVTRREGEAAMIQTPASV
jgi:lysozyme